jgi:hypothetical protein
MKTDEHSTLTLAPGPPGTKVCSVDVPAVNYPRIFILTGDYEALGNSSSNTTVVVDLYREVTGESPRVSGTPQSMTIDIEWISNVATSWGTVLGAGRAAKFSLVVYSGGDSSDDVSGGTCNLLVRGQSIVGTNAPFDELPPSLARN